MFTALGENFGNMQDKINLFVALCPITNLEHSSASLMKTAATKAGYTSIANALWVTRIHELMGPNSSYIQASLCLIFPCEGLKVFSDSADSKRNDKTTSDLVEERDHSSASSKQVLHFL
jgi:hypothetical protein